MRCAARLLVALALLAPAAVAASEVEVRAGVALPADHPVVAAGWRVFQETAKEASKGSLDFRLFVNGAVIGSEGGLTPLAQGLADMGFVAPAKHPETFPAAAFLAGLALLGEDGLAAAAALSELVLLHCAPCADEYLDQNLVFLGTYSAAPYVLIAASPLAEAGSLRRLRVSTPGTLWDRLMQAMGAVPVPPGAAAAETQVLIDVPMALRTKPLDETAGAVTPVALGAYRGASPFTANRDFWGRLTAAQRKALFEAAAAGIVAATTAYETEARIALHEAAERGVAVVEPEPDLITVIRQFADQDSTRLAATGGLKEVDAADLLQTYRALYGKYVALLGGSSQAGEARAVLHREIFARLDPAVYGVRETKKAKQASR